MDLDWLRYFTAVVDAGSIKHAANKLFISEATLSKSVSKLETELGVQLFERVGRGLSLTDQGQLYYTGISDILKQLNELNRRTAALAVDDRPAGKRETVVFQIGSFARRYLLLVTKVFERYPELDIRIRTNDTVYAKASPFDLAIVYAPFDEDTYEGSHIYDIEMGIATGRDLNLSDDGYIDLEDIRSFPFVLPAGSTDREFGGISDAENVEVLCRYAGFIPKMKATAMSIDALLTILCTSRSVAMIPVEEYWYRYSNDLKLYRIREPKCFRQAWIIWKKGHVFSDTVCSLIRDIQEELSAERVHWEEITSSEE